MREKKSEIHLYLVMFITLSLIILIVIITFGQNYHEISYRLYKLENTLLKEKIESNVKYTSIYEPQELIILLGQRFAGNHVYDINNYNCVNYSNDFQYILSSMGINSRRVSGINIYNESNRHRWLRVELDFEPITGRFVDYTNQYDVYWEEE